jgi:hypothetical protein
VIIVEGSGSLLSNKRGKDPWKAMESNSLLTRPHVDFIVTFYSTRMSVIVLPPESNRTIIFPKINIGGSLMHRLFKITRNELSTLSLLIYLVISDHYDVLAAVSRDEEAVDC